MPRTFQDTLRKDGRACISTNKYGQTVTYYPLNGTPREIDGDVQIRTDSPAGDGIDTIHILEFETERSATVGIDTPQVGDRLRCDEDPDGEFYSFSNRIIDQDESFWCLEFTKRVNVRTGGNLARGTQ